MCKIIEFQFQEVLDGVEQPIEEITAGLNTILQYSLYNTSRIEDCANSEYNSLNLRV